MYRNEKCIIRISKLTRAARMVERGEEGRRGGREGGTAAALVR